MARWTGIEDRELALAVFDWRASLSDGVGTKEEYDRLEARRAQLGPLWPALNFRSAQVLDLPIGKLDVPSLDTSSPERHMLTAYAQSVADASADRAALAEQMAALRNQTTDPVARSSLASVEANLRYQLGQTEQVAQLALSVANDDPRRTEWSTITASTYRKKGFVYAARAVAAWEPTNPDGWNMLAYGEPDVANEQRLRMFRRAVDLAPNLPLWSLNYTHQLVTSGQPARARSVAARLSAGGPEQRAASETILARIDCSNARFLAASTRTRKALNSLERFGSIERADAHLLPLALYASAILGHDHELADAFAERFVLPQPTRLAQGHFALMLAANACAVASRPIALRCFDRLRSLVADNWFLEGQVSTTDDLVDAAERYAKGDLPGAVAAWRSLVAAGATLPDYASVALDEAGESELAAQNDAKKLEGAPNYHGATLAHVREAKRAAARRDVERARTMATTVVDAWGMADTKVAAVDEMRKLLSTLPQPSKH